MPLEWIERYGIYSALVGTIGYISISWTGSDYGSITVFEKPLHKTFPDLDSAKRYAIDYAQMQLQVALDELKLP